MNRYWFYILDGERHGPVEPEEMLRLVRDRRSGRTIWSGTPTWVMSGCPCRGPPCPLRRFFAAPGTSPVRGAT